MYLCHNHSSQVINAPVIEVRHTQRQYHSDSGALGVFQYLDNNQHVTFLEKVHGLKVSVYDGKSTISCRSSPGVDGNTLRVYDHLLAIIYLNDYSIQGTLHIDHCALPVRMLSHNMTDVRELTLDNCTLYEGIPDSMSDLNIKENPRDWTVAVYNKPFSRESRAKYS